MSDLFKPVPEEEQKHYFGPVDSPENWWKVVDGWWPEIERIFSDLFDMSYAAKENPRDDSSAPTGRSIREELNWLKERRDSKLATYCHAAWHIANDAYAWSVPGWGQLCNLCSEDYVLYEDEMP